MLYIDYIYILFIKFFLARELNMMIGKACTPFKSFPLYDLNGIKTFFNDNKNLKLIIVILPIRTEAMYGKYIILLITTIYYISYSE